MKVVKRQTFDQVKEEEMSLRPNEGLLQGWHRLRTAFSVYDMEFQVIWSRGLERDLELT